MPNLGFQDDSKVETNEKPLRRGDSNYQIPEEEKSFVRRLKKQIEDRLSSESFKQMLKDIELNRKYARGVQHQVEGEDEQGVVRANLIHPELKKATNECYAKNPELDIAPKESVEKDRYEAWKKVGKTLELVLNHEFQPDNANLKAKAKRCVRAADTTGFGWLKVVFQKHIEQDPLIVQRMDDIQDNIQHLDRLIASINDEEGLEQKEEYEADKEELKQSLESLEGQKEIVRAKGISFTVRPTENIVFSDEVCDVEELSRAEWITDLIWMRESKCKERFGFCPKEAIKFYEKTVDPNNFIAQKDRSSDKGGEEDKLILVYERWNNADKRIYTMCAGYEGYLRDPFTPRKTGERFLGFFPLVFDEIDGSAIPNALVTQLRSMQDEHITTRSNFREHREKAVPFNVAHGSDLPPGDTEKLTNPGFMETVVLKGVQQGVPLEAVFKSVQHPGLDPAVYSTDHIRQDWEQVTRRGDAARGTIGRSKTATEADILQANLNVDTSERRDVVEDWFREIAKYCAELVLQEYTAKEVQRIAGNGAAWPQLTRNEVFDMVDLKVRVGSSGKPNAAQELERWIKMLPQFRESLLAIAEMQETGKDKQAEILTKLLRETIERFEERIDLDMLLPRQEGEEGITPEQQQEMQRQRVEIALQLRDMVSSIANRDADTMKKLAEAESKEVGPQLQLYTTLLQGMLNKVNQPTGSVQ